MKDRQPLDEALADSPAARDMISMAERDRALARAIVSTALRRFGQIEDVLGNFLDKRLPRKSGPMPEILQTAACQILFMDIPDHAAIDLAVTLAKQDRNARHFSGLANAVLRRVAQEGPATVQGQDAARLNTPGWLWERWIKTYGETDARRIAEAHLSEAALDLTVKDDPAGWAERLGGMALDTGSVRLEAGGRIDRLTGFDAGAWWVQDAAAALPARLLGDIAGKQIAELCAAPGGKTAQLAAMGARVTAVDLSGRRLDRLRENLSRLNLSAEIIEADAADWSPVRPFDAVLLDAPCTGTGTLRRHPDIARLKGAKDLDELSALQWKLISNAAKLLVPGGTLIYCTCSLEPEEGEAQVARLIRALPDMKLKPIRADEVGGHEEWLTGDGRLRTLPFHMEHENPKMAGMDGFFAARLVRDGAA